MGLRAGMWAGGDGSGTEWQPGVAALCGVVCGVSGHLSLYRYVVPCGVLSFASLTDPVGRDVNRSFPPPLSLAPSLSLASSRSFSLSLPLSLSRGRSPQVSLAPIVFCLIDVC